MRIDINGEKYQISYDPNTPLLWVLRDELELTGTKFGCGIGFCGACTVHVEGVATRACITPLSTVEGKSVRTIEGLAELRNDGNLELHPIQQAFVDEQVPQCGWCMSGQIMTAVAFLGENPDPTNEDIVAAMGNNYCRCGCYTRINRAVGKASVGLDEETI